MDTNIIKSLLNMSDVVQHYGYEPNRAGFICCPFHNEKTPSMKIYSDSYHCFGCGSNGDVISFVQKLFNLSFQDTLKKIDLDFSLNIYNQQQSNRMKLAVAKQTHKRNLEKQKRESINDKYWKVFDEWLRLYNNKRNYAPKNPDEEWHPLFIEALQKLEYQEFLLDRMVRI